MEEFYGDFDAKEYIEKLSGRLVEKARASTKGTTSVFDPRPFMKAFEAAQEDLDDMKIKLLENIRNLEDQVQVAEEEHRNRTTEMLPIFQSSQDALDKLESRIAEVGNKAVLVGTQLDSLDKQRIRAQEAKDLLLYFLEFNAGNPARLDMVNNSDGWNGKEKCAGIVKRLSAIAKEMDLAIMATAKTGVEKYCEDIEKSLLDDFMHAYADNDIKTMAICAKILTDFNGGNSCIQIYVSQHEFFTKSVILNDLDHVQSIEEVKLPLPKSVSEYEDENTVDGEVILRLYDRITNTLEKEWAVMDTVFPNSLTVIQLFLQRIFAQAIQISVEIYLRKAAETSLLHYIRSIHALHVETKELSKNILNSSEKVFDKSHAAHAMILNTVNRCRDDLFIPYVENDRYMEKELLCLRAAVDLYLVPFQESIQARKNAIKNKSMFGKLTGAAGNLATGNAPVADPAAPFLIAPDVELVRMLLKIHKDSVDRCRELSASADIAKNVSSLYSQMQEYIGKKYLDICVEIFLEDLLAVEKGSEPDFKSLSIIQLCNTCVHLLQNFFQTSVSPLVSPQPSLYRELLVSKNDFTTSLESKLSFVLQKAYDSTISWLELIVAKQKKFDFRPKDTDLAVIASSATQPCNQACEFLKKTLQTLSLYLDGKNLENFLLEVGIQFYSILLDSLKRFVISMNGGLILTKDIAKYQETVSMFKIPALNDRFEVLRQISNLYIVKPENLKTLLDEGVFLRMDSRVIHQFVANRADYKTAKLASLFTVASEEPQQLSVWEKTFEGAIENAADFALVVNDTFEEVGDSIKKMLVIQ